MEIKIKVWQVSELEESRNNLLLENQQLGEKVSSLQLTVQNLENSNASSSSRDASGKVYFCFLAWLKSTVHI